MHLPDRPVAKAIHNPSRAFRWIKNRIYEERIVTPIRAQYLFDTTWEVAVILDACRYDLAATRGLKHPIGLGEPDRVFSAASNSADWIPRTFGRVTPEVLRKTAYITGNFYTDRLPETSLAYLDEVWEYAWDENKRCVPPRPLTDRTITAYRNDVADRYIVHYMQPHLPPIADVPPYELLRPSPEERSGPKEQSAWERVKKGDIKEDVIRSAYRENLDPVLDEVSLLLENIDASKVVITADHGNYLGENGKWGHPNFDLGSPVRHVPWWETTAKDEKTHTPAEYETSKAVSSRDAQLRALGYQ